MDLLKRMTRLQETGSPSLTPGAGTLITLLSLWSWLVSHLKERTEILYKGRVCSKLLPSVLIEHHPKAGVQEEGWPTYLIHGVDSFAFKTRSSANINQCNFIGSMWNYTSQGSSVRFLPDYFYYLVLFNLGLQRHLTNVCAFIFFSLPVFIIILFFPLILL